MMKTYVAVSALWRLMIFIRVMAIVFFSGRVNHVETPKIPDGATKNDQDFAKASGNVVRIFDWKTLQKTEVVKQLLVEK